MVVVVVVSVLGGGMKTSLGHLYFIFKGRGAGGGGGRGAGGGRARRRGAGGCHQLDERAGKACSAMMGLLDMYMN